MMSEYQDYLDDQLIDEKVDESRSEVSFSQRSAVTHDYNKIFNKERLQTHFTIILPKTEVAFISKR